MRVALVHDWLTGMRGGEKVLEALCELYPEADIYTLLWNKGSVSAAIESHKIFTSFLQKMPLIEKKYRLYLPLMPKAIAGFDLKGYDLVVSSSHCVAKGVRCEKPAVHFCYCHTPMRYIWDQYEEYFNPQRSGLLTSAAMKLARPFLQRWDIRTAKPVDYFIANSNCVKDRISRHYNREARVIYPPVDIERFVLKDKKRSDGYYLMVTALVPYKKVDLAIKAFNKLKKELKIVGSGPDMERLKSLAAENIEFLGWQEDDKIADLYSNCRALIFPQEEDFGITAVEAQAAGKPVIAYGKGGALETVVEGLSGLLFGEPSADSLAEAVQASDKLLFDPVKISENVLRFSKKRFKEEIKEFINSKTLKGAS